VTKLRLVCIGNLTVDDIVLPCGAERQGCIGGDALYAALAARLFEPAVEMVARIGADLPPTTLYRIAGAGLSLEGLKPCPLPTLHLRVVYGAAGDRTWTTYFSDADFDALSPEADDIPPGFRDAEAFLVLAMTLTGQERLVAWARQETKALIALDLQEDYILGHQQRLMALIRQTDVFMPSAEEVRRLLGHEDWEAAARVFAGRGPSLVVIKLGQDGTVVYSRDRDLVVRCPALNVPAVDTTGAGDSFCGAMIAHLLQDGADLDGALRAGTVAASVAIGGFGAEPLFSADQEKVRACWRSFASVR
jgi:ribokinase